MVKLPEPDILPTIEAIYRHYEQTAPDSRRPHLGASLIGRECCRELWLTFRWCKNLTPEGRILRLFETGQVEENRVLQNLAAVGIKITGQQDRLGFGHFSGSCDGRGTGFVESSAEHIIEIKTANKTAFAKLKKSGVQVAKPEHYAQMQIYMSWAGLERAYYVCVCKDTDEIYGERIRIDKPHADALKDKAEYIINSPVPPEKLGDSEASFCCKWCDYRSLCWEGDIAEVNCRTCAHATPVIKSGIWECDACHIGAIYMNISIERQKHACDWHVYIPALVPLETLDVIDGNVKYEGDIINGPHGLTSRELYQRLKKCT